ncbi:MAG: hypothetical protein KDC98_13740 [Planctomycetes bacterium]|nr:hypothetical protein [Planctomycetota bacterium]
MLRLASPCFLLSLSVSALPAQIIHVANYTGTNFEGWVRTTVDQPIAASGKVGDVRWVAGRRTGRTTRIVDVRLAIASGRVRTIDLGLSEPWEFHLKPLPAEPDSYFGHLTLGGERFGVADVRPDGAGYSGHLRARIAPMLIADCWLHWYPDSPAVAQGEVSVTASNPNVPDLFAPVTTDLRLRFGPALTFIPGIGFNQPMLNSGEVLADGQSWSLPVTFVWTEKIRSQAEWDAAAVNATPAGICAYGLANLYPQGNPKLTTQPLLWARNYILDAIDRLDGWLDGPLGVAAWSGRTGSQEDQVFPAAEMTAGTAGLGAGYVRYLVALHGQKRPCHLLEVSGEPLAIDAHPDLVIWNGRPHSYPGISEQLGKSGPLVQTAAPGGWYGPDEEHWLIASTVATARSTGSPAMQRELEVQARIALWGVDYRPGAARAVGWRGLAHAWIWDSLENRSLADRVAAHWRAHTNDILIPMLGSKPADIWDVRDDPRLQATGMRYNWMSYQQALGAYGLDYACEVFNQPAGRQLALRAARCVVDRAFARDANGRWQGWAYIGFDPVDPLAHSALIQGQGAAFGPGIESWMVLAPATILRHFPNEEPARSIFDQFVAEASEGGRWLPPELLH